MTRYSFDDDDVNPHAPSNPINPSSHPGSAFARLRAERQYNYSPLPAPLTQTQTYPQPSQTYEQHRGADSSVRPPSAPAHAASQQQQYFGRERDEYNTASMAENITPGADNYGEQAAGGIAGIAMGVADNRPRESGLEAVRNLPAHGVDGQPMLYERGRQQAGDGHFVEGTRQYQAGPGVGTYGDFEPENPAAHPAHAGLHPRNNYLDENYNQRYDGRDRSPYDGDMYGRPGPPRQEYPNSSHVPLGAAAAAPMMTGAAAAAGYEHPQDVALHRYSQRIDPSWQLSDPNAIADDGDDGLEYTQHNRGSMLSIGRGSDHASSTNTGTALAGGAATGGIMGALGGLVGRNGSGNGSGGVAYGPVNQKAGVSADSAFIAGSQEKSEWLAAQKSKRKKLTWILALIVGFLVLGGIAGGIAGALVSRKNNSSSSHSSSSSPSTSAGSSGSASQDAADNGDLSKDSAEIKALLNNTNLRKVFPGIDYTPMYTQFPDCLTYPPSQNNVTRDLAVISQLTNVVRLYGTDCNQTEMVLHAIDRLGLQNDMKVWLGVWQDKNASTNARQLSQMYKILADNGPSQFVGAIIGNEILFRDDMSSTALGALVTDVKANFTALGYKLPVTTSDVGDKWTQALADKVDYVMSNVHPFFTGKVIGEAAEFTWSYWQNQNFPLKPDLSKNFIAETGWPTKGGTDCGPYAATCPQGSVAGVQELNQFMDQWVCQALSNGTNYFWFEAFDEPWKIKFNTAGKEWEDQWGLMDVDRNLKAGVKIPDCAGKRVGA